MAKWGKSELGPGRAYTADRHYVTVWGPNGRRLEHRVVMEGILGRRLRRNENVHHINGNGLDNSPDNLELWVGAHPAGQRPSDLVAWAHDILRRYDR